MEEFLRGWRQDALNKHQYDSAIFIGDKLLALTSTWHSRPVARNEIRRGEGVMLVLTMAQMTTRTPFGWLRFTFRPATIHAPRSSCQGKISSRGIRPADTWPPIASSSNTSTTKACRCWGRRIQRTWSAVRATAEGSSSTATVRPEVGRRGADETAPEALAAATASSGIVSTRARNAAGRMRRTSSSRRPCATYGGSATPSRTPSTAPRSATRTPSG